ncbi:MAG: hypothetical protein J3R72DRAFT_459455 [Linnemannia gamsii]|nr:MAG: hypothetical protein J3R72DRAFT_459455 [Linnemannia gamsii]
MEERSSSLFDGISCIAEEWEDCWCWQAGCTSRFFKEGEPLVLVVLYGLLTWWCSGSSLLHQENQREADTQQDYKGVIHSSTFHQLRQHLHQLDLKKPTEPTPPSCNKRYIPHNSSKQFSNTLCNNEESASNSVRNSTSWCNHRDFAISTHNNYHTAHNTQLPGNSLRLFCVFRTRGLNLCQSVRKEERLKQEESWCLLSGGVPSLGATRGSNQA